MSRGKKNFIVGREFKKILQIIFKKFSSIRFICRVENYPRLSKARSVVLVIEIFARKSQFRSFLRELLRHIRTYPFLGFNFANPSRPDGNKKLLRYEREGQRSPVGYIPSEDYRREINEPAASSVIRLQLQTVSFLNCFCTPGLILVSRMCVRRAFL